jgi:hypothetical protein
VVETIVIEVPRDLILGLLEKSKGLYLVHGNSSDVSKVLKVCLRSFTR